MEIYINSTLKNYFNFSEIYELKYFYNLDINQVTIDLIPSNSISTLSSHLLNNNNLDEFREYINLLLKQTYDDLDNLLVNLNSNKITIKFTPLTTIKINILTAMHIEDNLRILFFKYMVESIHRSINILKEVSKLNIQIVHYVSYYNPHNYIFNKINSNENYNIIFNEKTTKHTQFDHFQSIFDTYLFNDNDIIMFFDDDDLMLTFPKEIFFLHLDVYECIMGYQYIPIQYYDKDEQMVQYGNIDQILKILPQYVDNLWNKRLEFSGYISKYIHINKYFKFRKSKNYESISGASSVNLLIKYLVQTEDLNLMQILNNLNSINPLSPFIFHRIWNPKGGKEWVKSAGLS